MSIVSLIITFSTFLLGLVVLHHLIRNHSTESHRKAPPFPPDTALILYSISIRQRGGGEGGEIRLLANDVHHQCSFFLLSL